MESRMDQYELMEQIGRGAFGAAILVHHKAERKKYSFISPLLFIFSLHIRLSCVVFEIQVCSEEDQISSTNGTLPEICSSRSKYLNTNRLFYFQIPTRFFFLFCFQMALIARVQHPYIVEFKEAWVEKVMSSLIFYRFHRLDFIVFLSFFKYEFNLKNAGLLCLYCHWIL